LNGERIAMPPELPVPHYFLYEEQGSEVELDFLHIEAIRKRSGAHDWTIAAHAHPHHVQVLLVEQGGGTFRMEDHTWEVRPPCLIVVPVATAHAISFLPDTDGWVVTAASGYVGQVAQGDRDLAEPARRGGIVPMESAREADDTAATFAALHREFVYSAPGRRAAIRGHFLAVLVALLRAQDGETTPHPAPSDRDHALATGYREELERSFRQEKRLDFYAGRLNVTPARLNAACRARMGTTASAMLHDRIVTEAKRCLIYTAWSVAEVGYSLGFEDPAYFNRFFSRRAGISPGGFRARWALEGGTSGGHPPT
jgi:AraC family transcriptional regulator, transcriptional activator of pobA